METKQFKVNIYYDDELFTQNDLTFSENNPSSKNIAFVNEEVLKENNINFFSYYLLNNKKLVCLFGSQTVKKGDIHISQAVGSTLKLQEDYVTINFSKPIPTKQFDKDSNYNFLPNVPVCHRILLSNIWNNNSNLFDVNILTELLQEVFYVQVGDVIALDISKIEDLTKFKNDKKKLQKLIKYSLTRDGGKQESSTIYENSKKLLLVQVENIFVINSTTRDLVPYYQDKEQSQACGFIVDIKNRETDIRLDSLRHNKPPIYPVIQQAELRKYKKYIEQDILSNEFYSQILSRIDRLLRFSFNQHVPLLMIAPKGSGKRLLLRQVCERYGMNYMEKDVKKLGSLNQIERLLLKGVNMRPCMINIRNLRSLVHFVQHKTQEEPEKLMVKYVQEFINKFEQLEKQICSNFKCVLVFTMEKFDESSLIDNNLKNIFTDYLILDKIKEKSIYESIIKYHATNEKEAAFFDQAQQKSLENLFRVCLGIPIFTFEKTLKKALLSSPIEKVCDSLVQQIENLRKSSDIESLSIPNVRWEDVGGLQDAKNEIIDTIMLPQLYPQVFDEFVRPRTGLLFFGPPGTGKTLLAKCIATETKMNFLSVKGPELLNMYIGESEKNVRDIFSKARRNQPCVIFFDELDALAPNRGNGSDSSQVMDRIVAQFLTELDDINKEGTSIFVVGATNRPDLLDQGLLRPGRFDKLIYLGINTDEDTRTKILQAQTRKLKLDPSVDFKQLLENIPKNFTGADFYGLTSQTVLKAARRKIKEIEATYQQFKLEKGEKYSFNMFSEEIQTNYKNLTEVTIQFQDFDEALKKITPSVSEQELKKYEELKQKFQ
ncbi:AAA family ATPase (macronuclear) [Tetrahymena thermophila SB210]|uniref:Peroxisomal ATPase PEX6 n=1 Tax=Tetrahymena thermophila (strain SB210) TaxID=312017 RepID=Q23PT9_TETTS|nr:AAA family ATPase [Tetrahymena thermophila SB210]EAR98596.1 AAA family ATPase [Tetrahymena thermophila SB210]|eukprot:XP_001018841.1 AAA family ATPase [Tetrahymena thermophila SB210]